TGVGKTGVVGLLEGAQPGPTILLRFDIDALPITEETGVEYASTVPGVMHACGHDAHVATGLTVARLLSQVRGDLKGQVKFMFQPAEEGLGGAVAMMADGVLDSPAPEACFSLHVWNDLPIGWMGIAPGPVMAGAGRFTVKVTGRGGHGAQPQTTLDPIVAGAQIVTAMQSLVSRNISPLDSAVVSIAQFHAGEAFNVIPQFAELKGTIRTFDPGVRQRVFQRFTEIAQGIARAMGCQADVELAETTPPVVNDARVTEHVVKSAECLFPNDHIDQAYQTMGSEDMAYVMQKVPGCYFFVGAKNDQLGLNYGHHHPKFDIDEAVLPRAASLMAAAAVDYLS
ncbi:MAG TPA: amidohydrolase, partial [Anaerolineaceae bacterium]|nr:amidohydrolase [Anaerolineaceae bacterium]